MSLRRDVRHREQPDRQRRRKVVGVMRGKYNDRNMRRLALGCGLYLCLLGSAFGQTLPGQIDPQRIPALSAAFRTRTRVRHSGRRRAVDARATRPARRVRHAPTRSTSGARCPTSRDDAACLGRGRVARRAAERDDAGLVARTSRAGARRGDGSGGRGRTRDRQGQHAPASGSLRPVELSSGRERCHL